MTDSTNDRSELPFGWVWTSVEDVCTLPQYGYTTKATSRGNLKLLRTTDITSGQINWDTVPYCTTNPDDPDKYLLRPGDIVISRAGSVGASYLIDHPVHAVFASYLIRFRPKIDGKYFRYFLKSPHYWKSISEKKLGIAIPNINANKLKSIRFPLPPLPEQHRIVAKIEELFSDLDASVAALAQAQAHLRIYRQAVLKYAFDGRLTERWRAQHAPPPASELLAQIQAERAQRTQRQLAEWEADVHRWEAAGKVGRKPARPRQPDELAPLSAAELEDLGELPEGWAWARVADVGEVRLGRQRSPERASGPNMCQYMRAANVTWNGLDLTDIKSMDFTPEEQDTYRLHKGDILLSEASGSVSEVGKPAIWREQIENCCFQNTLIRVRPEKVLSEYLHLHFYFDAKMERFSNIARGVGIHHLGANGMTYWTIALPSVTEQQAIVAEVEARLSVVDKLEETLAAALRQAEALRQSILQRAFAGKLVPQDPSDEPAQQLLERIRKARPA